jgi:2-keto-4-pentenoate hydratase/2-oxohepta-3-ene-1,7-dioic acid hydratase in catechol pathway
MRLVTFKTGDGHDHIGVVRDSKIIDLTMWLSRDHPAREHEHLDMVDFIAGGERSLSEASGALEASQAELEAAGALVDMREQNLLAPIPRPRKNVLCMGRNYQEHAAESRRAFNEVAASVQRPPYPSIFTKANTAVNAPFGDIPYDPNLSEQLDWEVELALVIGAGGKDIRRDQAMRHVFGYMVLNDISARDIQQRHGGQYFKGKSLDGACPTGPWIVTADEIPNPDDLGIVLRVNGVTKQEDRTSSMLFNVSEIVEQMSRGMTLEPGDVIATGTPGGVGMGRTPPEYLHPGDVVECEIEKIGKLINTVVRVNG